EALGKLSRSGPYFFGAEPTLVDFAFYPWFERFHALERHTGFEVPRGYERIHTFWKAVAARESVKAIANPTEFYLDRYRTRLAAAAAPAPASTANGRDSKSASR
ncbi:MAG TPA: glutathione S-transferase C-terminal domain-containing protein, partial [Polyangiaceae bacterium]|nr:glutathione S-transferase C-terminal domain-containing protein [Polyangiaceae bacterium]